MYITIQNEYSDREPENGCFYICGYIQVDNEKPMKIQGIRYFKINDGYHTINYYSKHPSSAPEYTDSVSREFKYDDWVNIKVYARSYGIMRAPDISFSDNTPNEILQSLDDGCSSCRQMIQKSYEDAKRIIRNARNDHPDWPKSFFDGWEKDALEFIESVDKRCCLATEEFATWKRPTENHSASSTSSCSATSASSPGKKLIKWGVGLIVLFLFGLFNTIGDSGAEFPDYAFAIGGVGVGVLLFVLGIKKKNRR